MMIVTGSCIHAVLPNGSHHVKPNFEVKVDELPFYLSLSLTWLKGGRSGKHEPNFQKKVSLKVTLFS